jgi:RHS repeat-associated protein
MPLRPSSKTSKSFSRETIAGARSFERSALMRAVLLLFTVEVLLLISPTLSRAQSIQYTQNKPDQAMRSAMRVDPATLGLSIEVPIGGYPGRGGTSVPITYSGLAVTRAYDAENRITKETQAGGVDAGVYSYDGDGHRIKRIANGIETWQVYGIGGELLAEYTSDGTQLSKEYGYRNGELLVTAEPGSGGASAQAISWTGAVGVSVSGNTITKTAANGWGNAAAVSTQSIASGNGYVEFTAAQSLVDRMCGLSHGDGNQSYEDIDFGIFLSDGGYIYVYESGVMKANAGPYAVSDILRVAVEAGQVKYYKNGTVFYTSTATPTYPLIVDTAIYSNGASISNVMISAVSAVNVNWQNVVGATASGNSLTKTAGAAWGNAGASSTQTITSGDGYVEFTAAQMAVDRTCGLSNGDSSQSYEDIDFGIFLSDGGYIYAWESGVVKTNAGPYATSDRLKVAVENGQVKYYKNGTLFYTSTATPSYPLLVDTALYTNSSTISNVVISGAASGGSSFANIKWLVTDQLGTPRMVFDQTGSLANVSRHDYLPFGEELFGGPPSQPGVGGRTTTMGYTSSDNVRQKFTAKERDNETGLDYSINRYYSSAQGRFSSVDPTLMSIDPANPQTLNRYTYALNNPLAFVDPDGLESVIVGGYDKLTDEQKRLFQTYVDKNYADQIGDQDATAFAERLWNESAIVANIEQQDVAVVGANILTQSQLTTFLGVTNMLAARGVSGEVASINSINGDIPEHEFRLIGELKNNSTSVNAIEKAFPHSIAGKGHSPYDISRREQGMFGQPNGQANRIPNGTGVDVDVD